MGRALSQILVPIPSKGTLGWGGGGGLRDRPPDQLGAQGLGSCWDNKQLLPSALRQEGNGKGSPNWTPPARGCLLGVQGWGLQGSAKVESGLSRWGEGGHRGQDSFRVTHTPWPLCVC